MLNQCECMYSIDTQLNSYTEYASFGVFNELPCLNEDSMNVLMCDSTTGSLTPLTQLLDTTPEVHIVDVVRNGRDMALALKSKDVHLSVLAPEVLDLDLIVEKSRGFIPMVKKVVVASPPTAPLVIKAHQYGVNDVIPLDIDTASLLQRFQMTIEGKSEIENHPVIKSLKFKNGQFNKIVKHTNDEDVIILQLLSLGMSDSEISLVTEISIQLVRNRIAELIIMNDLANRTQLAVLQATNLVIPDFA
jgi:DNA-binding NarL/FixJ family response regulator